MISAEESFSISNWHTRKTFPSVGIMYCFPGYSSALSSVVFTPFSSTVSPTVNTVCSGCDCAWLAWLAACEVPDVLSTFWGVLLSPPPANEAITTSTTTTSTTIRQPGAPCFFRQTGHTFAS